MYVHACVEFSVCHNAWGNIHPSEEHGAVAGVGSGCVVIAVYKEGFVEGERRTRIGWGERKGENYMMFITRDIAGDACSRNRPYI